MPNHKKPAEVELTENPTREEVAKAWPEGVLYKGEEIFEVYVKSLDMIGGILGVGTENSYEEEYWDEDDEEWCEETCYETIDGQESYLGYVPLLGKFISGWDMWGIDDNESSLVLFTYDNLEITEHEVLDGYKRMMYHSSMWHGKFNSNLEKLESTYPDIIHIRLD